MSDKITLVGKIATDEFDDIAEGFIQVEFKVQELLEEIGSDVRDYARNSYDLIPVDELGEASTEDLADELESRDYDFIRNATPEALINAIEPLGYKVLDEYDEEYYEYLKISNLDVQDMRMLKEITKRFIDASVFQKEEMYEAVTSIDY